MKKYIVAICLLLNGCFYQSVNMWDIERAITLCGNLDNVVEITASFDGNERVICKPDNNSKRI